MEEIVYLNSLYDYYKNLLTEKQQQYFEDYYQNNLTLSEIADNYGISRNAVHKQLKDVTNLLNNYEQKLQIVEKNRKIISLVKNDEKLLKEIEGIIG